MRGFRAPTKKGDTPLVAISRREEERRLLTKGVVLTIVQARSKDTLGTNRCSNRASCTEFLDALTPCPLLAPPVLN
jgi:hypothetical protein